MGIIVFILVLSLLVLVHELGHFLTAKKAGMRIAEFGLGYPPRALTLFTDKHGTEYTVNWFPFGGFVRIYGENGEEEVDFGQFINWQDSNGETALHKVFQNEKVEIDVAKLLVSSGAEISVEDATGATPLEKANEQDKSTLMIEARKFTASKK